MQKKSTNAKLGYIIIYVPDLNRTVEFYQQAFGIQCRFIHESGVYAELETGETALAFADETVIAKHQVFTQNRPEQKAAGAEIAFVVDDVALAFQTAVAHGAEAVMAPAQKPWGQTVSYVRDLNGFLVELCSAIEN